MPIKIMETTYQLNVLHKTLEGISCRNKFKKQHSIAVNITFFRKWPRWYVFRVEISERPLNIRHLFVNHLLSRKPKVRHLNNIVHAETNILQIALKRFKSFKHLFIRIIEY